MSYPTGRERPAGDRGADKTDAPGIGLAASPALAGMPAAPRPGGSGPPRAEREPSHPGAVRLTPRTRARPYPPTPEGARYASPMLWHRWSRRRYPFEATLTGVESGQVHRLRFARFRSEQDAQDWVEVMNAENRRRGDGGLTRWGYRRR